MKYLFLLYILFAPLFVVCQDKISDQKMLAEGDRYFEAEQYALAIQYYQELTEVDNPKAKLCFKLAACYHKTFEYQNAEMYYLKAYNLSPKEFPEAFFYYGMMLKLNGSLAEAAQSFQQFIDMHHDDKASALLVEQAEIEKEGCEMGTNQSDQFAMVETFKAPINSPFNDYAPTLLDSTTLVVTSGRINSNRQAIDDRYGEGFSDQLYLVKETGLWQDRTKNVFATMNTRVNDGSGCFNRQGDKYYYTVCGAESPLCRIYFSQHVNGKWSEPILLNENINKKDYDSKQPALSRGGDTLFFVSNRKGGFGLNDIWMSVNDGDNAWGPPMNMGKNINTKMNEISPLITPARDVLFFASDGHKGYGGLDLYVSKRLSSGDTVLYNLDAPFNSSRDDCFPGFATKKIYWASNRKAGLGGFDVYAANIHSLVSFLSKLSLKNKDARRNIKLKSRKETSDNVNLMAFRQEETLGYGELSYAQKKIVDEMMASHLRKEEIGHHDFPTLTVKEFEILYKISKQRHQEYAWQVKMDREFRLQINLPLTLLSNDVMVQGTLIDSLRKTPFSGHTIILTDSLGEVIKITKTNEEGKFRIGDLIPKNKMRLRIEELTDSLGRPMVKDFVISKAQSEGIPSGENIYFDFDRYQIRPEASLVLNDLATYLKAHPQVQVDIFAFADDVGTNAYNILLSQKRGMATLRYLIARGVDETSLSIVAKGKIDLMRVDFAELERQQNRRVEFYLSGSGSTDLAGTCKTYINKNKISQKLLSEKTGMTIEQLQQYNLFNEENIKPFQPVRIPSNFTLVDNTWAYFSYN